jgi:hypothetical protein
VLKFKRKFRYQRVNLCYPPGLLSLQSKHLLSHSYIIIFIQTSFLPYQYVAQQAHSTSCIPFIVNYKVLLICLSSREFCCAGKSLWFDTFIFKRFCTVTKHISIACLSFTFISLTSRSYCC